jgi:phage N-6-adenine-methyltransferase
MIISPALFSSESDEWATPLWLFRKLNQRYNFTLDSCATKENAKCPLFFTKEQNGLEQDWGTHRTFCNPPYSAIKAWARKCFEASRSGALVVLLAPARPGTSWYHDWVKGKADKIEFIKGRLQFGNAQNSAPFDSMLAIYSPNRPALTCAHCGEAFFDSRSDAQYCKNACRQAAYRNRSRYG